VLPGLVYLVNTGSNKYLFDQCSDFVDSFDLCNIDGQSVSIGQVADVWTSDPSLRVAVYRSDWFVCDGNSVGSEEDLPEEVA
jgi:hypothetical protein